MRQACARQDPRSDPRPDMRPEFSSSYLRLDLRPNPGPFQRLSLSIFGNISRLWIFSGWARNLLLQWFISSMKCLASHWSVHFRNFSIFSVFHCPFDSWKMPWFGILGSLFTANGTQSNVFMVLSNNNNINEANNEDCIVKIHRWANKSFLINHLIFNTLIKPVHQGQTDKDSSVKIFWCSKWVIFPSLFETLTTKWAITRVSCYLSGDLNRALELFQIQK